MVLIPIKQQLIYSVRINKTKKLAREQTRSQKKKTFGADDHKKKYYTLV